MLKLVLWLRYLRKHKIVFLSIGAVALSVTMMSVVNSIFSGYIRELELAFAQENGDILIGHKEMDITQYDSFLQNLRSLEFVETAAPQASSEGLLHRKGGIVREVQVSAIVPEQEEQFKPIKRMIDNKEQPFGSEDDLQKGEIPCWLGLATAADVNEVTGAYELQSAREVIGQRVLLTTFNKEMNRKVLKLRVVDIVFAETVWKDKTVFVPLNTWNRTVNADERTVEQTKIAIVPGADLQQAKEKIKNVWQDFAANTLGWSEYETMRNANIYTREEAYGIATWLIELRKQMAMLLLIFGVICGVTILLVFCIFYMIVESKRKDIAIIKSCGASNTTAAAIFVGFGGCVGIVGSGLGVLLGWLLTKNVNTIEEWIRIATGMKLWRSSSYMLNKIPNDMQWSGTAIIVLAAIAGCCLGALVPAMIAAIRKPVTILRYE